MRHVHLPHEDVLKQESAIDRLADSFLQKQALRPQPSWYANLLEEHQAEIAAAVLLWFLEVQDALAMTDWTEWTDPFLWSALEEKLARLLAPHLREAARASARQQAVQEDEPIPLRQADSEIAMWAGAEAARQARLIADETWLAVIESLMALSNAEAADSEVFSGLLAAGFFGLTRRFAGAALSPVLRDGASGLEEAVRRSGRLLEVRQRMIGETNTVSSVLQGMLVAGLLWERDGKAVTKSWRTQEDERVCPVCLSLHFQEVPLRGYFSGPRGEMYERPPAHPFCRCFVHISARPLNDAGWII